MLKNTNGKIHKINVKQHQVAYFSHGKGEVLVFLHGWPNNSRLWDFQVEALSAEYRIITIDWLGFGESDKPMDHTYRFAEMKEMLDAVLADALDKSERITVIAHDIGGPPAILWASENQERVHRLILLNTVIYPFSTPLDKISHTAFRIPIIKEIIASQSGLRILMKFMTKSRGEVLNKKINEIINASKDVKSEVILKTILEPVLAAKKNEFLVLANKFKNLKTNKHLVIAKGDPLCYKHIQQLSDENPNVPVHYIEKCGHSIPIDRPGELNEILRNILGNDSH